MKKNGVIALIVAAAILGLLWLAPSQETADRVTFYYAKSEFGYGSGQGTIGYEVRDVGRKKSDLTYMLALYLQGPMDSNLSMPFPGNNIDQVKTVSRVKDHVFITLADLGVGMTDSRFNLSCACLTKTCLSITDAKKVTITSGDREVTMTADNLITFDESTAMSNQDLEEEK